MYYVLKLHSEKGNLLIEGIYSTKGSADEKANYYLKYYRNNIKFYSVDEVTINNRLYNENVISKLI